MNEENRMLRQQISPLIIRLIITAAALAGLSACAQFDLSSLNLSHLSQNAQTNAEGAEIGAESADAQSDQELAGRDPNQQSTLSGQQADAPVSLPEPQEEKPTPGKLYDWSGDGRNVTRVIIDTNEQKARFYDGNEQIGWTTIASGVAKHPTPRGEFTILEKVKDKRSNLYGKIVNRQGKVIKGSATSKDSIPSGARFVGASMPHFMRMTYDGIGMHAGPIPRPGSPASHGCIRMPKTIAAIAFDHIENGTAVTVIGNGPDYGNYGERIARQQAEQRARRAAAAAAADGSALDALDAEIAVIKETQGKAQNAAQSKNGDDVEGRATTRMTTSQPEERDLSSIPSVSEPQASASQTTASEVNPTDAAMDNTSQPKTNASAPAGQDIPLESPAASPSTRVPDNDKSRPVPVYSTPSPSLRSAQQLPNANQPSA